MSFNYPTNKKTNDSQTNFASFSNIKHTFDTFKPEYETDKLNLEDFLLSFSTKQDNVPVKKYLFQLQKLADEEIKVFEVFIDDLQIFFDSKSPDFVERIKKNTKRYITILSIIIEKLLPKPKKRKEDDSIQNIYLNQRLSNIFPDNINIAEYGLSPDQRVQLQTQIPLELYRKYEIIFSYSSLTKSEIFPMRTLKSDHIGSFITIKAIVVRQSEVRQFIKVATYLCYDCNHEIYQIIHGKTFMPVTFCASKVCKNNKSIGDMSINTRASKFYNFQEIKIQELPDQVPVGHVPRSMTIFLFNENVNKCSPGDKVQISGVFLPQSLAAKRSYRTNLIHETYLEAFSIIQLKGKQENVKSGSFIDDDIDTLKNETKNMKFKDSSIYNELANSLAPEIFGMDDVKKALLLQLVGGKTKITNDGMKIRGDINILLMGDPGVAKSQLLKYVCNVSPRGVFTTGKGSSGVGLTAAIVKDPITNDYTLEGGALVMADNGICCIDEFDKMSDYDRSNIYEVMEQQTVSIAKAGITTRLNARTSILAAANPLYGRYNKLMTPYENINLPAALLSRFDIVFLLLDNQSSDEDTYLAKHILSVHKTCKAPVRSKLSQEFMKRYIEVSQKIYPKIPYHLHTYMVEQYVKKRKEEFTKDIKEGHQYITPRSLLAIIRLSQSLAKLQLSYEVSQGDIEEAIRLIESSRDSVNSVNDNEEKKEDKNFYNKLYNILKDLGMKNEDYKVAVRDFEKQANTNGIKSDIVSKFLYDYTTLNLVALTELDSEKFVVLL